MDIFTIEHKIGIDLAIFCPTLCVATYKININYDLQHSGLIDYQNFKSNEIFLMFFKRMYIVQGIPLLTLQS